MDGRATAGPPWSDHDKADAGAVQAGGAERQYPSLSIAETISDMSGLPGHHQARSQTQRRLGCFSGEAMIGQAYALKVRALVRLGELLKDLPKAKGNAGPGRGKAGASVGPAFTDAPTLSELGLDKKTSMVAQQLAALPEATREAIAQREMTLSQARRETKAADVLPSFIFFRIPC